MASTRPPRADARRNRQRLLDATRAMLAERGSTITMDEIARASGLGSGTLYRHFPHRDELLGAVIADSAQEVVCELQAVTEISDPAVAWRAACHAVAAHAARDRTVRDLIARELEADHLDKLSGVVAVRAAVDGLIEKILDRACRAGLVRSDVASSDISLLLVTLGAIRIPGADPNLWERYLDIVLDGLKPQPSELLSHQPPTWPPAPPAQNRR